MKTLSEDIKTRNFKRSYLLCGEEEYLVKNYKKQLIQAINGGDTMNSNFYEGKGLNVKEIIDVAETMPFMAEYRLVVLEDTEMFKSGGDELAEYVKSIPESTIMLFVESNVDKRSKLYKAVKEHKTLMNFDGLLYIAGTTPILVVTFGLILINCIMYVSKAMTTWLFIVNILNYLIPTLLFPIFTALFVMVLEKKPIKPMIKGLLCYPAFMGTWVIINLKCLFKRETTWEKIEHVRDIKIAEVKEEEVPEKI